MDDSRMASYLDHSAGRHDRICYLCAADGILTIGQINLFGAGQLRAKNKREAGDVRFFDGRRSR